MTPTSCSMIVADVSIESNGVDEEEGITGVVAETTTGVVLDFGTPLTAFDLFILHQITFLYGMVKQSDFKWFFTF